MADDRPEYRSFLLGRPCRCQPCVAPVIVHHNTFGDVHASDRELPAKAIRGKRGKGQRASDMEGISLCHRHHGQLHSLTGYFAGWDKRQLREWQSRQVGELQTEYAAHLEKNPPPAAPPAKPVNGGTSALAIANRERGAIVDWLRRRAGERRLAPEVFQELSDRADELEAMTRPLSLPRTA